MTTQATSISFKPSFAKKDLETVKSMQLVNEDGDHHTVKKDNFVFDGVGGVEALLFVTEQFWENASYFRSTILLRSYFLALLETWSTALC